MASQKVAIKIDGKVFFNTDKIKISQGFHGKYQNGTALDFAHIAPIYAPFDGCYVNFVGGIGQQQYFHIVVPTLENAYIEVVHARPATELNQRVKKGDVIGYCNWHHYHIAVNNNGKWHGFINYFDRNTVKLELVGKPWQNSYDSWTFYTDRYFTILQETPAEISINPIVPPPIDFVPPAIPELPQPGTDGEIETPRQEPTPEVKPEVNQLKSELETAYKAIQDLVKKLESWNWSKLFVGVIGFKNPIANLIIALQPAIQVYRDNQVELATAYGLIGSGAAIVYPIIVKLIDKYKNAKI